MLDEKRLAEIRERVMRYLKEGAIVKETKGKFVPFVLNNSRNSLGEIALEAKALTSLGRAKRFNEEIRKILGE